MIDPLSATMQVSATGLRAQGTRMRVVAENIANANSTAETKGGDPFRRKTISFASHVDRSTGADTVEVKRIGRDRSDFKLVYDPAHPAADESGYVKQPNVNMLVEMMDMREATRSYEASLNVIEQARAMMGRTLDMLRSS